MLNKQTIEINKYFIELNHGTNEKTLTGIRIFGEQESFLSESYSKLKSKINPLLKKSGQRY